MSKLSVTNFTKRTGSPFQNKNNPHAKETEGGNGVIHEEVLHKASYDVQKEKQHKLEERVSKKAAEIHSNKLANSDGCFVEVVTHGAFQTANGKSTMNNNKCVSPKPTFNNGTTNSKSLMGFPSSANDLALEAKSDLETDRNISEEVKEKVIKKMFALVSMVQHMYESKVRVMTEYDKFKEKHLKDELRREKEHSEQLYKLNINFQTEVVQTLQQLRTELDISRSMTKVMENNSAALKQSSIAFSSAEDGYNRSNCHKLEMSFDEINLNDD